MSNNSSQIDDEEEEEIDIQSTQPSISRPETILLESTQVSLLPSRRRSSRIVKKQKKMSLKLNSSFIKLRKTKKKKKYGKAPLFPRRNNSSRRQIINVSKKKEIADDEDDDDDDSFLCTCPPIYHRSLREADHILNRIDAYRGKRLTKYCYCPITWATRIKDFFGVVNYRMRRYLRASKIVCCPPCCTIPNRIAFWPPPCSYFFFRMPPGLTRKEFPEGVKYSVVVKDVVERKKKYIKLKKADRKSMEGTWSFGMAHDCTEDILGVECFVLETEHKNFIACVRIPYEDEPPRYSILYSHPSGSDISDHLYGVPSLKDMARFYKCDIYSYDYCGYGISSGRPSESNQNADIRALYKFLTEKKSIPPSKIIIMGYSIGTSCSVDLVSQLKVSPAGIILEAPPLSILRLFTWNRACFGQPWKKKTCCWDRYSIFDKIDQIQAPVLVIHGTADQMVPLSHGKEIRRRAKKAVEPCWMPSVDHDTLENYQEVWRRIRLFLDNEVTGSPRPPVPCLPVIDLIKKLAEEAKQGPGLQ